jgi:hypothetical protein
MNKIKKIVNWLLLVVVLLYILTGFGISQYQVIGVITFGFLTKVLAYKIHSLLIYPLVVLLVLHVLPLIMAKFKQSK